MRDNFLSLKNKLKKYVEIWLICHIKEFPRKKSNASLYGRHSLAVPAEPIGKAFTDGSKFASRTGSAWEAVVKCSMLI